VRAGRDCVADSPARCAGLVTAFDRSARFARGQSGALRRPVRHKVPANPRHSRG